MLIPGCQAILVDEKFGDMEEIKNLLYSKMGFNTEYFSEKPDQKQLNNQTYLICFEAIIERIKENLLREINFSILFKLKSLNLIRIDDKIPLKKFKKFFFFFQNSFFYTISQIFTLILMV